MLTKVIKTDLDQFFMYPEGCSNIADLAKIMNSIKDRYILLRRLREELTVEPCFIDDFEETYVNIETIGYFSEAAVEIYSEKEYDELLAAAVRKTCGGCAYNGSTLMGCTDLRSRRCKLALNGECDEFDDDFEDFEAAGPSDTEDITRGH
ncbi:MAG: hypothetical protein LKJ83_01720 [Eubacteriaceae bacterium]|jgi:hypothetical protein|nr:hypothetical protein [Eubacteriaceae bacterium]